MSTAERRRDIAREASFRSREEVGRDFRRARLGLDLSLRELAGATGISSSQLSRIERAELPHVALEDLVAIGVRLGRRVSVRTFPGGAPLRDAAHVALLERFRGLLHPTLGWSTEVPVVVSDAHDLRGWDAMIRGDPWRIGVEAETRIRDAQDLERRIALKERDGRVDHVILLLAATRWNRQAARAAGAGLIGRLPLDGRRVIEALRDGHDPQANGIVFL